MNRNIKLDFNQNFGFDIFFIDFHLFVYDIAGERQRVVPFTNERLKYQQRTSLETGIQPYLLDRWQESNPCQ